MHPRWEAEYPQPAVDQECPRRSPPSIQRSRAPFERRTPWVQPGGGEAGCLAEASPADARQQQNTNYRKKQSTLRWAPPFRKVHGVYADGQLDSRTLRHTPLCSLRPRQKLDAPPARSFAPIHPRSKQGPSCSSLRRADQIACTASPGERCDLLSPSTRQLALHLVSISTGFPGPAP